MRLLEFLFYPLLMLSLLVYLLYFADSLKLRLESELQFYEAERKLFDASNALLLSTGSKNLQGFAIRKGIVFDHMLREEPKLVGFNKEFNLTFGSGLCAYRAAVINGSVKLLKLCIS